MLLKLNFYIIKLWLLKNDYDVNLNKLWPNTAVKIPPKYSEKEALSNLVMGYIYICISSFFDTIVVNYLFWKNEYS